MGSEDVSDRADARKRIATLIVDPGSSRQYLPAVLGELDAEDRHIRLGAAAGICLAGTADQELLPYILRRLVDRLHSDDSRAEAVFAFEYLATQFPTQTDEVLQELREESDREPLAYGQTGGFRRSDIYSPSMGRRGVGRTRFAGTDRDPGPQQVYHDEDDVVGHERPREREREPEADHSTATPDPDQTTEEKDRDGQASPSTVDREPYRKPDWGLPTDVLSTIIAESGFEDITILADRERGRFADVYRTLSIAGGSERAVGLRLFRRPENSAEGFSKYLSVALDKWNRVSATDHVVSLYDRGQRPRPWAAVAYTEQTLADRGHLPIGEAIWNGVVLARAVSTLHDNGVVHGGLDPRSIAYTGNVIDDSERQAPLLDHVGLLEAFRFHFDPAECLDPRFAAPEYYDAKFGEIDHTTDIYQLGTTLYRLFTGAPPYDSGSGVKDQVLSGSAIPPSRRRETIPELVDEVVSKATAPQKLTRYETAAQLEQDLLHLRDHVLTDGQ